MNKTTMFSSARAWRGATVLVALLLLILSLVACGAEPTPTSVAQVPTQAVEAEPTAAPTDTEAPVSEAAPTDTEVPEPTDTPAPTEPPPTPTPTATPTPIDDTGCITCHTSQETLQAMATEEEAPEVESEGEG